MNNPSRTSSLVLWLSAIFLALSSATPSLGQAFGNSPAAPVPEERYSGAYQAEFAPVSIAGDTTRYRFNYEPGCNEPMWYDIRIQGNLAFTVTGSSFQTWDLTSSDWTQGSFNGEDKRPTGEACKPVLGPWRKTDTDFYMKTVAVPPTSNDIAVAGMLGGMGFVILDTSSPNLPQTFYQDENLIKVDVIFINRINGKDYLFVLDGAKNIVIYDLTAARALRNSGTTCYEPRGQRTCQYPVYVGILNDGSQAVNSKLIMAGSGRYLLTGQFGKPMQVWDVASAVTAGGTGAQFLVENGTAGWDMEMWQYGGSIYYASLTGQETDIYQVPPCGSNCNSIKIATLNTPGALTDSGFQLSSDNLTYSKDGADHYLYVGKNDFRGTGPEAEYLFSFTDPANARKVSPGNHPDGYWGWYYQENLTGFRNLAPRAAQVWNNKLVRAAWSVLDMHELTRNAPPNAAIGLPSVVLYGGDNVALTDNSTGTPNTWSWTVKQGATTVFTSSSPSPNWASDGGGSYPATFTITLQVCNDKGCDTASEALTLEDPQPSAGAVTANVSSALQCSTVTFDASNATGRPDPLQYGWDVVDSSNNGLGVPPPFGPQYFWKVPGSLTPGMYRGRVTVSNDAGSDQATSLAVQINALPSLTDPNVTADPPDLGAVEFHVTGQGATTWTWDFGDGTAPVVYTDPVVGPNPVYQYTDTGTYTATVTVDNCLPGTQPRSDSVTVEIDEVELLEVTRFEAILFCAFGQCFGEVNQPVSFRVTYTGNPTSWQYDWNGNDAFVAGNAPVNGLVTHTYAQAGTYTPKVRITRGGQVITKTHDDPVTIEAGGPDPDPPSVTVSGATSSLTGQTKSYNASAQNCTATGWSWTVGSGGTIQGSSTSSTIQVEWSSVGNWTVRATAAGGSCNNASSSRTVSVTEPDDPTDPPVGGLDPDIKIDVSSPGIGQTVTFDASSSGGGVEAYYWEFGDGTKVGPGAEFVTVEHTYNKAGTYRVKLEVSKSDPSCVFNTCVAARTFNVTVGLQAGACTPSQTTMCLRNGRFKADVTYETVNGKMGSGSVVSGVGTSESGIFYFFRPDNWEMLIKVLDGCNTNDFFWVFAASTTNVGFELTVTDLESGKKFSYVNPIGKAAPAITNSEALDVCTPDEGD